MRMNEKTAESRIRRLRLELEKVNGRPVEGPPVGLPIPVLPVSDSVLFGGVLPGSGTSSGNGLEPETGPLPGVGELLPGELH